MKFFSLDETGRKTRVRLTHVSDGGQYWRQPKCAQTPAEKNIGLLELCFFCKLGTASQTTCGTPDSTRPCFLFALGALWA